MNPLDDKELREIAISILKKLETVPPEDRVECLTHEIKGVISVQTDAVISGFIKRLHDYGREVLSRSRRDGDPEMLRAHGIFDAENELGQLTQ